MSKGQHLYNVLTTAFDRDHLLQRGKDQGVGWNEDNHEGVNWMRFSRSLTRHLSDGKEFHVDETDPGTLQHMVDHLCHIRDLHKQTMVPHVRAAMTKLQSDDQTGNHKHYMEYLSNAYNHLDANGGHVWLEKVNTLRGLNSHINKLKHRIAHTEYQN